MQYLKSQQNFKVHEFPFHLIVVLQSKKQEATYKNGNALPKLSATYTKKSYNTVSYYKGEI